MVATSEPRLDDRHNSRIALRIREELARRRITRQKLAADAMISLSTLEKALSGRRPFTMASLVRLEQALDIELRNTDGQAPAPAETNGYANGTGHGASTAPAIPGLAPEGLGSYARPAVTWIEGDYLTLRPSFGEPEHVYAYRTQIHWNETDSALHFRESNRIDEAFTQWGQVSIPHQSGHIYLVTNRHGQYRLIILSRPTISGEMHGILTTLQAGKGAHLTPVATPIAFIRLTGEDETSTEFGRVGPASRRYREYRATLDRTLEDAYALFLNSPSVK